MTDPAQPEPVDPRRALERHLDQWVHAYGADLAVTPGEAVAKPTAPTPEPAATPEPVAAPEPVPQQVTPLAATEAVDKPGSKPPELTQPAADPLISSLRALRREVLDCTKCKLHQGRQTTVFGEGDPKARVMFIGEAPGAREDQTGRPFVGPAGQLLDRILSGAMGLQRPDVFIANINKCRPPGNRAPEADEVAACLPYLKQQVELVKPEVLVCLGRTAAQNLLGSTESTTKMRQKQHEYAGIPVIVTWHPAYLLREPSRKRETWEDIKRVNQLLGLPEVPRG